MRAKPIIKPSLLPGIVLSVVIALAAHAFTHASQATKATDDFKIDPKFVIQQFNVLKDGEPILVPVTLKGKVYQFLLDTGTGMSLFDNSLEPLLGASVESQDAIDANGHRSQTKLFAWPDAELGKMNIQQSTSVASFDLKGLRQRTGLEIYGVLGMDALTSSILHYDPEKGLLEFLKTGVHFSGRQFYLSRERNSRCPLLSLRVGEHKKAVPFLIDTGAYMLNTGSLENNLFEECTKNKSLTDLRKVRLFAAGGTSLSRSARLNLLSLGEFKQKSLTFVQSNHNLLGLSYLARFRCTFDFKNDRLYLTQTAGYDRPAVTPLGGISFRRVAGGTIAWELENDGPAAEAGIKQGDELVSIENQRVAQLSMHAIRRLLATEGRTLKVVVRRGGTDLSVSVILPK